MSSILTIQALFFLLLYFFLIIAFFFGWLRTKQYKPDEKPAAIRVSILIPCRNENENVAELAAFLNNQDYPNDLLQIIWIDDHSTDGSDVILNDLIQNQNHWHLIKLSGPGSGKKAALKAGMEIAAGEMILLTDADSRPGTKWVKTMAKFFEDTGTDLILGPVVLDPAPAWFDQIQKLEYLSLVASSIGASGLSRPVMAQGPNIAVRATDYLAIVNDLDNRFASGDDVFLLQAMKKIPGKKIGYVLNPDAIVRTKPAKTFNGFLIQRQRWASKASGYRDPFMILTTLTILLANLTILVALLAASVGLLTWHLPIILLSIKSIADLFLLIQATRYFRCCGLLRWFVPVQVLYPAYIIVAAGLSVGGKVKWR